MNYISFYKDFAEAILTYVKKGIDTKSHSDKSFKCTVTGRIKNKYQVLYCGNTYNVSSSVPCEVGDYVWVCAPCNRWNDLFIVCKAG